MRFVHTADWQIGMKAAHAGSAGARVREERFKAAARVVDQARRSGAEFMLLAGDTFEHTFEEAGEFPYYCAVHPNMIGTVSVS